MRSQCSWRRVAQPVLAWLMVAFLAGELRADSPSKYPLRLPPLAILDGMPPLKVGTPAAPGEEERQLLEQVWKSKSSGKSPSRVEEKLLLDALLFASGVEDRDARKKYAERYQGLVGKARKAVENAKTPQDKGEKLMRFLHANVLNKGYEAEQTSLAVALDTGKFNCVSSVAVYYLFGAQLGFDLHPISIPGSWPMPGHASLDMIVGGKRIEIEPTNPNGFDWGTKSKAKGVVVFGFVPDRKESHEVDALGIAAMIYSNRGVAHIKATPARRMEAIRCFAAALALDPADKSACDNLLSVFTNWGPALADANKFEEALRVLDFGVALAAKSDPLHTNRRVVWHRYLEATLAAGQDKEALTLTARARAAEPEERDFTHASEAFCRFGDKCAREKGWDAGLALADRGLKVLADEDAKLLREWRSSLFRRWSQALLEKKDPDGSLKVLARAYALNPSDKETIEGIAFHSQEAFRQIEADSGLPALTKHYQALRAEFPKVAEVAEAGQVHVRRAVEKQIADKQFKEALAALDKYQSLLPTPKDRAEVGAVAYDRWAQDLAREEKWQAALDKYGEGLKAFPKQERLTNNLVATVDRWARPAMNQSKWDEAIGIYLIGLRLLPSDSHLQHNREYCEKMKLKKK